MNAKPSILFLHENYPAQFGALADHLSQSGWNVLFATQCNDIAPGRIHKTPGGVSVARYTRSRETGPDTHRYLVGSELAVLNGQAFARLGASLKKGGFNPDIIVAHSGWGSGSFAKVVWPQARFVQYLEWWYGYPPVDLGDDHAPGRSAEDEFARTLARNLPFLLDFQQADLVISPTRFQADQVPDFVREKLVIQHDGVDCSRFHPADGKGRAFTWDGLPDDAPIVTFATRGMEPTRGFPTFMAAASRLLAERDDVHVVIAGGERAHYGPEPTDFPNWKAKMLAEHAFDFTRLHFTGLLPKTRYVGLLQRSAAHVYLSQPFVLSWSLIEAMACGAPIVATDVAPVREALGEGRTARWVPPQDPDAVLSEITWFLENPGRARNFGQRARRRALAEYEAGSCHRHLAEHFSALLQRPAAQVA